MANNTNKIDCHQVKMLYYELYCQEGVSAPASTLDKINDLKLRRKKVNIKYAFPTLEVHGEIASLDKMSLDIRTYIGANGLCNLQHNRSHRRISNYNWNKMKTLTNDIDGTIIKRANKIIYTWLLKSATNRKKQPIDVTDTLNNSEKKENNKYYSENKCDLCDYPRPSGTKHIHFIKGKKIMEDNTKYNRSNYPPIESVFSKIGKMAEDNSNSAKLKRIVNAPGKPILQTSNYRMSYGDLNYLGSNKAIFYFDRGIRRKQIFNNSMYPLEQQPKYKDLVVIDDIALTSTCKYDSANQHKMFPHTE